MSVVPSNGSSRTTSTQIPSERVLTLGVYGASVPAERRLAELASLVRAAGGDVVHTMVQRRPANIPEDRPITSATYIGSGKVLEVAHAVAEHEVQAVVFDNELSPAQIRELESRVGCRVLDRSEVILDIFASRARTKEASLQVELAQLQYTAPRLRGMWSHLARQAGGGGGGGMATRGPGEQQLEIDRRIVQKRILLLKERLAQIEARRERQVEARSARSWGVGLVGYTNAGKSTLLNALTHAEAYAADQLFATLDTVSRRWEVQPGLAIPLSDTVGFVRDLPHHLVTGFRSTLAEALHAALLLHVVDASHPDAEEQVKVVQAVLAELGVPEHRVLGVLNKCDQVADPLVLAALGQLLPGAVRVSAVTGEGLEKLARIVADRRSEDWAELQVHVPHDQGALVARVNARGEVVEERWEEDGWHATVRVPRGMVPQLREVLTL
ncbi:MAG: GTPase HflX [Myxococcales bacterium]|nr:GTPase HflX [Myxococcales bacterium]MCA9567496.1 GTPase HflX [Myxococcales bacterium]